MKALRLILVSAALLATAACAQKPIKISNMDGQVTSIGPVYEDADGLWVVSFSVSDFEGDAVDILAETRAGAGAWTPLQACGKAEAPCIIGGLKGLSTAKRGEDVAHSVRIRAAGGTVQALQLRMYADVDDGALRAVVYE